MKEKREKIIAAYTTCVEPCTVRCMSCEGEEGGHCRHRMQITASDSFLQRTGAAQRTRDEMKQHVVRLLVYYIFTRGIS